MGHSKTTTWFSATTIQQHSSTPLPLNPYMHRLHTSHVCVVPSSAVSLRTLNPIYCSLTRGQHSLTSMFITFITPSTIHSNEDRVDFIIMFVFIRFENIYLTRSSKKPISASCEVHRKPLIHLGDGMISLYCVSPDEYVLGQLMQTNPSS